MGFLTVNQLLADLQQRGFVYAFEHLQLGFSSLDTEGQWSLQEYEVMECYHYRRAGKPVGSLVILAIQTHTGQKGVVMYACGEVSALESFLPSSPAQLELEHQSFTTP
jgi:hypothetical protein